jgi:uncharacterized protein YlxW (UPF0749 family)
VGGRVAAFTVFLLAGSLFATSALASRGTDLRTDRLVDLASLVQARERHVTTLEQQVGDLRAEVHARTEAQSHSASGPLQAALDAAATYGPLAGLNAADGTAVIVTLDDARDVPPPAAMPPGVGVDDYVVHQQDIEGVVNALWAGGASAMMIMDQRVISTSAVRCVGTVLSLQGRTYSPPYTIAAIGDPDALRAALGSAAAVQIFREYADELGLGYKVATDQNAQFPAYGGALTLQFAEPVVTPPVTP